MLDNGVDLLSIKFPDSDKDTNKELGVICSIIFTWLFFWLMFSFVKTIITDPETIPSHFEWDMVTENNSLENASKINANIQIDMEKLVS
mgnify:CR=1 FL=1